MFLRYYLLKLTPTFNEVMLAGLLVAFGFWANHLVPTALNTGMLLAGSTFWGGIPLFQQHWVELLVLVVFWGLVGLGLYAAVWALGAVITELRNDAYLTFHYTKKGRNVRLGLVIRAAQAVLAAGFLLLAFGLAWTYTELWPAASNWDRGVLPVVVWGAVTFGLAITWRLFRVIFSLPWLLSASPAQIADALEQEA